MRVAPMTHAPTQPSTQPRSTLHPIFSTSLNPATLSSPNRIERTLLERYALGFWIRIVDMETTTSRRRTTRVAQQSSEQWKRFVTHSTFLHADLQAAAM
jgi:hypothetical protein